MRDTWNKIRFVEEQRLKVLVNGSLNPDYSDSSDDDAKKSPDSGEEASESLPDHSHQPTTLGAELPDFSYDRASYIVKAAAQHSPSQA